MAATKRAVVRTPVSAARAYLAVQAVAGALWWLAVFASDDVRRWTLGGLHPRLLVAPDVLLFVGGSALAALRASRASVMVTAVWTTAVTAALLTYGLFERSAGWGVVAMAVATLGTLAAAATIWFGRLPTKWFFIGPFSFRVADRSTGGRHLRRSLVQLVIFWSTFFIAVPLILATLERRLRLDWPALDRSSLQLAAAGVFVVASALGLWSCVTMALIGEGTPLPAETARNLVVAGPYRYVRNPMAVAGALQTASMGLWHGSWGVITVALAGAVAWNVIIRPEEENDLANRFGVTYERYRSAVRCWIPTKAGQDLAQPRDMGG